MTLSMHWQKYSRLITDLCNSGYSKSEIGLSVRKLKLNIGAFPDQWFQARLEAYLQ